MTNKKNTFSDRKRRKKARQRRAKLIAAMAGAVVVVCATVASCSAIRQNRTDTETELIPTETQVELAEVVNTEMEEVVKEPPYKAQMTDTTMQLTDGISSQNAILIDLETGEIIAEKGAMDVINPASMTKILTILVGSEHLTSFDQLYEPFVMPFEATDYSYVNGCSTAGFVVGEQISVADLFYGTILPSGAEAAVGLATATAGSQEAFVGWMNEKLEELGLSKTAHFTNAVGVYAEDHHCSVYDMAMILEATMDNEWCRQVMTTHSYTATVSAAHPTGLVIVNKFFSRVKNYDMPGTVIAAKTGYVDMGGSCAASYAESAEGKAYICVTAGAPSGGDCAQDHANIYRLVMQNAEQ